MRHPDVMPGRGGLRGPPGPGGMRWDPISEHNFNLSCALSPAFSFVYCCLPHLLSLYIVVCLTYCTRMVTCVTGLEPVVSQVCSKALDLLVYRIGGVSRRLCMRCSLRLLMLE
jgi:hypothetical protein